MTYLAIQHICRRWGDKVALNNISFSVSEGQFVALLGPSGCGKSTLLRTISGLDAADSGSIHIQQRDVSGLPPSQRKLSMVFQSYALFPHLNVRENLLFGLRARGEDKQHFTARLQEVSTLMGLETLMDRLPGQLSGGQQQRVALGRAVIARHRLCLMDEPLSNLDAKLRQSMRREIRALQKKLGLTMLYVTHDQTEAMSMADRIILMNEGRIEQHDTPEKLYNDPASVFVAQFIGAPPMNIVPLTRRGHSLYISSAPAAILTDAPLPALSLGLRPEQITITSPQEGKISGRIQSVEYMGADTLVTCEVREIASPLSVTVAGMRRYTENEAIGLTWPVSAQYLFNSVTGQRCHEAESGFSTMPAQAAS